MLRSILFPYSNYFIERKLNSEINRKFSTEFSKLIKTLSKIVKIMAELEPIESYRDDKKQGKKELKREIDEGETAAEAKSKRSEAREAKKL